MNRKMAHWGITSLLAVLLVSFASAEPLWHQVVHWSGTPATGTGTSMAVSGMSVWTITASTTSAATGTLVPQGTADNTSWRNLTCTTEGSGASVTSLTVSASSVLNWRCNIAGLISVRAYATSTNASGTWQILGSANSYGSSFGGPQEVLCVGGTCNASISATSISVPAAMNIASINNVQTQYPLPVTIATGFNVPVLQAVAPWIVTVATNSTVSVTATVPGVIAATIPGIQAVTIPGNVNVTCSGCSAAAAVTATITQLPASFTMVDSATNPTLSAIQSYMMCYNASTSKWDRCQSGLSQTDNNNVASQLSPSISVVENYAWSTSTWVRTPNTATATGAPVPPNANYMGGNGSGNMTGFTVCDNWTVLNTATSAQLITGTASKRTYICSVNVGPVATGINVSLVAGTGTLCATGINGLTGGTTAANGWNFPANGGIAMGHGIGVIMRTATTGDNVCVLLSTSAQVSGAGISWTQY